MALDFWFSAQDFESLSKSALFFKLLRPIVLATLVTLLFTLRGATSATEVGALSVVELTFDKLLKWRGCFALACSLKDGAFCGTFCLNIEVEPRRAFALEEVIC